MLSDSNGVRQRYGAAGAADGRKEEDTGAAACGLSQVRKQGGSPAMHPPFRFHKHERGPPGTAVLCAERPTAGGRDARRQGVQCGDGTAVPRPALAEKRERHTAGGRLPEDGKAYHQGRERPDGPAHRKRREPGTVPDTGGRNQGNHHR